MEGRFWSAFIILVVKKFLAGADGSAILPTIGSQVPPIGLYLLILTAVSPKRRNFLAQVCKVECSLTGQMCVYVIHERYLQDPPTVLERRNVVFYGNLPARRLCRSPTHAVGPHFGSIRDPGQTRYQSRGSV